MSAADKQLNVYQRLLAVQKEAKAPREISGKFGKGRSAEQILEAVKPVCSSHGLYLYTSDVIVQVGERNYVSSTATVVNVEKPEETHSATASAWEGNVPMSRQGQEILDTSQVSGKTASYAKKYALQNLFAIDDTKDTDQDGDDVVYRSTPRTNNVADNAKFMNMKPADLVPDFIPEFPDLEAEFVSPDEASLKRAKEQINEMLEDKGHTNSVKKLNYVYKILGKKTIDTMDDATKVADALEGEV